MILADTLRKAEARLRASDIEDPRLEAEVLLCHALGIGREALYARPHEAVRHEEGAAFEALISRRLAREPSAYIVGQREFFGLELACSPAALIPRPETELLVEEAIAWLSGRVSKDSEDSAPPLVADVGTGNGAIAVAVASHAPEVRVVGIDTSGDALALAQRNAQTHDVTSRIEFVRGELLAPLRGLDLIVANLPYIPTRLYQKLPPEIREHEPEAALHAGRRGTAPIEAMLKQAAATLRPGGLLLAEHAWNQGRSLREAARAAFPSATVETQRDLGGRERVLAVRTIEETGMQ